MGISSIHFENVKPTSQSHNLRLREFDYVRQELTHLNASFEDKKPHSEIISELKEIVKQKTGRAAQGKAKFILEGVFLFEEKHTNEDLKNVAAEFEEKFKAKMVGLHIHRDEGHYDENKVWKPNLHAHLLIENIDRETGKSHRWNKEDLSNIQTFFAEALQMERGKRSEKKHLNPLEHKIKAKEEQLKLLEEKVSLVENILVREEKMLLNEYALLHGKISKEFATSPSRAGEFINFLKGHPEQSNLEKLRQKYIELKKVPNPNKKGYGYGQK